MGRRLPSGRAGIYPPTFFFPDPAESIPPVYAGGGRRGNNININTMALCRGPPPTIVPRGLPLTRSGGIPLSLTYTTPDICHIYPYMSLGQPFLSVTDMKSCSQL